MTTFDGLRAQGFEQFAETKYDALTISTCMRLLRQYQEISESERVITEILNTNVPIRFREQVGIQCKLEGLL